MIPKSKLQTAAAPAGLQPANNGFSLISNKKLLQLYATMLKCRMLDERMLEKTKLDKHIHIPLSQGKVTANGFSALGHEAATVGVAIDLHPEDTVSPSHADLITPFIQGEPLENVLSRLDAGTGKACSAPAWLNSATGAALANKTSKNKKIAVALSRLASAPRDSWDEALHFAGLHQLPILFVWQNGLGPGPVSPEPQIKAPKREDGDVALKAQVYGIPCIAVDGNDVVAVYRVASESIARARQGCGPTLIQCKRLQADDPILNMEKYLIGKGLFSVEFRKQISVSFSRELEGAIEMAGKLPSPESLFHAANRDGRMIE